MSAPDPKEAWQRIQNELTRRSARFGGSGGGPPRGLGGGVAGLLLLGGGFYLINNALFNGTLQLKELETWLGMGLVKMMLTCSQLTVVIEQSNTPG